jgi:hypothetical protein
VDEKSLFARTFFLNPPNLSIVLEINETLLPKLSKRHSKDKRSEFKICDKFKTHIKPKTRLKDKKQFSQKRRQTCCSIFPNFCSVSFFDPHTDHKRGHTGTFMSAPLSRGAEIRV